MNSLWSAREEGKTAEGAGAFPGEDPPWLCGVDPTFCLSEHLLSLSSFFLPKIQGKVSPKLSHLSLHSTNIHQAHALWQAQRQAFGIEE